MNFQINSTDLLTEPTNHNWVARTQLGFDGNAHAVYPANRQYSMAWDWMDAASFSQLVGMYNACSGTMSLTLPTWNSATGGFASYNGTLTEPSYTNSMEGFFGSVKLLLVNVK